MAKVRCLSCGAEIMPSTAARNEGLCAPCKRGTATTCRVCGGRAFRQMRELALDPLCGTCRVEFERHRPTRIEKFVRRFGRGECSVLVGLFRLEERLRREGPVAWIGLHLIDPPERYGTDVTPRNSIAFAGTGGNEVHFSLVSSKGRISDESMVVMTNPSVGESGWNTNVLVGENLREFLSLGCTHGYSCLERVPYDRAGVVEELRNGPDPDEIDDEASRVLREYRRELGLTPWSNIEARLQALESQKRLALQFGRAWPPWSP